MDARVGTAPSCIGGLTLITQLPRQRLPIAAHSRVRVNSPPTLPPLFAVAPPTFQSAPPLPLPSARDAEKSGPIELPEDQDLFSIPTSAVSPLQSAASILLTGAIAIFLYRSLQRRAKLVRETKFRSSGLEIVKEASKEGPVSTLNTDDKANSSPSAFQTLQGAVLAGVLALGLYKFATSVEAGFALKAVSPVYTIRQLTITVRTIVSGLLYLATFVFAANSVGLTLYSLQLLFNFGSKETTIKQDSNTITDQDPSETEFVKEVKKE